MNTPLPTGRAAYRAAVARVAALASEKLPDSLGRIASAVKLVLAGVEYHLVNGVCECALQKQHDIK